MKRLGKRYYSSIYKALSSHKLEGVKDEKGHWLISEESINAYSPPRNARHRFTYLPLAENSPCITALEVIKTHRWTMSWLKRLVKRGKLKGIRGETGELFIDKESLSDYLKQHRINSANAANDENEYLSIQEAQVQLGYAANRPIFRALERGKLIGHKDDKGHWRVTKTSVNAYERSPKGRPRKRRK